MALEVPPAGEGAQYYRGADGAAFSLAEYLRRASDRLDPAGMPRSRDRSYRGAASSSPFGLRGLLQRGTDASPLIRGCPGPSSDPDGEPGIVKALGHVGALKGRNRPDFDVFCSANE
jgi:hypothetical protein